MDDDEDFLYGGSTVTAPAPPAPQKAAESESNIESAPIPTSIEKQSNGIVAHLEAEAELEGLQGDTKESERAISEHVDERGEASGEGEEDEENEDEDVDDESDEDIEIILEPQHRSLDFRAQRGGGGFRSSVGRGSSAAPQTTSTPAVNLTTEYTPRERGAPPETVPGFASPTPQLPAPTPTAAPNGASIPPSHPPRTTSSASASLTKPAVNGPDPSTLPVAHASASAPSIDPTAAGMYDSRPIYEIDMDALSEKNWRRPGSDLSDWFNYGFDELSWEAYCYRRRTMGDMADVLKANVLTFAGMGEEAVLGLPPDARTMVLTGTNALMNSQAAGGAPPGAGGPNGPQMPPPGMVGMNVNGMPMGQMPMEMGMPPHPQMALGMGMNGEMGMGGMGGGMMPEGMAMGPNGTPEIAGHMALPEGMPGGPPGMMGLGMNMTPEFAAMQAQMQESGAMHPHPNMPGGPEMPIVAPTPTLKQGHPSIASTHFRGRGAGIPPAAPRGGRGTSSTPSSFPPSSGAVPGAALGGGVGVGVGRGRGRGTPVAGQPAPGLGAPSEDGTLPKRSISPLPPNVPTGPKNPGNRYKDRDNNATALEGLDYGGGGGGGNVDRESEEKSSARKRRSPPTNDDVQDRMGRNKRR